MRGLKKRSNMKKNLKKNLNKDFIKSFVYPGSTIVSLASLGYCLCLIYLTLSSFFMGNFLTGVLLFAYLSGVIYLIYIKKDFFNGGGEGMFYLKTTILLFIIPLVFALKLTPSVDKGAPDLLAIDYKDGEKYCVYSMDVVNAKRFGGSCPSYKNW